MAPYVQFELDRFASDCETEIESMRYINLGCLALGFNLTNNCPYRYRLYCHLNSFSVQVFRYNSDIPSRLAFTFSQSGIVRPSKR